MYIIITDPLPVDDINITTHDTSSLLIDWSITKPLQQHHFEVCITHYCLKKKQSDFKTLFQFKYFDDIARRCYIKIYILGSSDTTENPCYNAVL